MTSGPGDDRVTPRPDDRESQAASITALASADLDDVDAALLDTVARAVAAADPMPAGLVERATFAVALDELQAEVAALQVQGLAEHELAGVRSGPDHTLTMTFTASALALTLAVVETDRGRHRIDGWVTSEHDDLAVTLRLGDDDRRRVEVDAGRFAFTDVPSGMVQVLVSASADGTAMVVTPAFEL